MPLKTHVDEDPSLNLTSMIDVLFLLIIFFMTGTKFAEMEHSVGLQVPQVAASKALPVAPDRITINVFQDGSVTLNQQPVSLDGLTRQLSEWSRQNPTLSVIVRADAGGTFQNVAQVLAACRESGVTDLGINVRMAQQPSPNRR